jgi:hypothetical protein
VRALHEHASGKATRDFQRNKPQLLATLADMPDFQMQMNWCLGSMLFSPLLKQFAPYDTYTIWKQGTRLRVDGTLMGLDEEAQEKGGWRFWKRGHFSLLFCGELEGSQVSVLATHFSTHAASPSAQRVPARRPHRE